MDFAVPSFVIAIIGIVLQVADAFPEHRETRKTIVIMSLGVFLGASMTTLLGASYEFKGVLDMRYVLLLTLLAVTVLFAMCAIFIHDHSRREIAGVAALISMIILALCGFGIGIASSPGAQRYTVGERLELAASAEKRGDFDRALDLLGGIDESEVDPGVFNAIKRKVEKVKTEQSAAAFR